MFWNETGILTLKSIFSSFEYSYCGKNGDFLPIYGYFGAILIGALYLKFLEFWKYAICYCFLLFISYKSDFKLHKAFSHHFNVQIMAKMVFFHLFQDILAAILKAALYLEFSRILKICYMLLLLTVYRIQIWFQLQKTFSHHFSVQIMAKMVIFHLF